MNRINRVIDRVKLMFARALIQSVDDTGDIQLVKISALENEVIDSVERLQPYGFTGVPPKNSEALVGCMQGVRSDGVAIVVDAGAHRLKNLSNGETAQYSLHGQSISMTSSGNIDVTVPESVDIGNAVSFVALADRVDQMFDLINSVFTAWTPPSAPTIDNGAALKAAWTAAWMGAVETGCTKLRAE